jgi:D-serine deaminase-like pyridoxal phosphate-dependent protein
MGKPVDKISKQMVDHLFASITSSGKLSTASKVYKLLSSIFKRAVDYGYLEKNPCSIKGANNLSSRKKVSTPSATASVSKLITEIRPGVYIFNDSQQVELGSCGFQDVALVAFATVVSGTGQKIVVDSGGKILGADRASWATGYGRLPKYPAARITALSEHHATVIFPKGQKPPKIGSTVTVIPNHVCNAVNLVDYLYLKKADGSLKKLKVLARGKNS